MQEKFVSLNLNFFWIQGSAGGKQGFFTIYLVAMDIIYEEASQKAGLWHLQAL